MSEFNAANRLFVSYIDKSCEYYLSHGYGNPYRWACYEDVPFSPLTKPLSNSRVGLVSTARLVGPDLIPDLISPAELFRQNPSLQGVYTAPTVPPPVALYTDHLRWDKEATHTRDVETFLPIRRLQEFATAGRIRDLSPRFYGVPTDYSQRRIIEEYAPTVLDLYRADAVDVMLLVAL